MAAVLALFPFALPKAGAVPAMPAATDPPVLIGPENGAEDDSVPEFTWNAAPDVLGYKFQLATSSSFTSRFYEATVSAPSVQLPQAKEPAANTTYYWRVATIQEEDGQSGEYSDAWTFLRKKPAGPALVGPLPEDGVEHAVVKYPSPPVLEWAAVPGAKDYTLQYSTDASFVANVSTKTTANTSFTLGTLAVEGSVYYWRVRANLPSSVTSDYSATSAFKVTWPTDLRPTLVAPEDSVDDSRAWSQVHFRWTSVAGAAKYQIQITPDDDFKDIVVDDTVVGTSYVPLATLPDDTYYWRVRALSSDTSRPGPWSIGNGPDGFQRTTRVYLDHGLPARPSVWMGLPENRPDGPPLEWPTTAQVPADAVVISWTPIPGASDYEVQVATSPTFMGAGLVTCRTPHTSVTSSSTQGTYRHTDSLDPARRCALTASDTARYVRVRAVDVTTVGDDSVVNSLWSNDPRPDGVIPATLSYTATTNPDGPTVWNAPAVKQFPVDGSVWEDAPVLGWEPVDGATRYKVALSVNGGFTSRETDTLHFVVNGTRFVPPQSLLDNDAGKPFHWFVLPCNATDCGVGDNEAIPTAWTFTKASHKLEGLKSDPLRYLDNRSTAPNYGVPEAEPCSAPDNDGGRAPNEVTGVCLSWEDPWDRSATADDGTGPGTKYYRLQVSTDPNFATTELNEITDATAIIPDMPLNDATYHWRVRIVDGGDWDGPWAAGEPFTRPTPPQPDLDDPSAGSLPTLSWVALAGAGSTSGAYQVEVYAGTTINGDPIASAGTTSAAYAGHSPATGLKRGTYTWRVRMKDTNNVVGPWSEAGTTFDVGVPPVQYEGPADKAAVSITSLVLDWVPIPGVSGHRVDISTKVDFSSIVETADVTGDRWTLTKLTTPGTYYWRVRGLSSLSSDNVLSAPNDPVRSLTLRTLPGSPTALAATAGVSSGIPQLSTSWTAPTVTGGLPISGYRVRYRQTGTGAWTTQPTSGVTTGATLIGLNRSTEYEVQVAAVNALGQSKYTSSVKRSTPGVPGAPGNVTATVGYGQAAMRWSAPSGNGDAITSYVLRYAYAGSTSRTTVVSNPATGSLPTTATLTGLTGGVTYTVSVRAKNGLGEGPATSVSVPTPVQPGKPLAVKITRADRALGITWQPPANAAAAKVTGYLVERRSLSGTTWSSWSSASSSLAATARGYIVTGLTNGRIYQLRVTARAANGYGLPSDPLAAAPAGKPSAPSVTLANVSHRLRVTWTRPATNGAPLLGYTVQTSRNNATWTTVASPTATATSFTWSGARRSVTYYVRVSARNLMGTGAFSTVRSLKVT